MDNAQDWLKDKEKQAITEIDDKKSRLNARNREFTKQKRRIMRAAIARKRRAEGKS